jgi:hypothetical protein
LIWQVFLRDHLQVTRFAKSAEIAYKLAVMAQDVRKQIERFREEIHRHDYLYYVLNQPKISDRQYDRLFTELKEGELSMMFV